MKITLLLIALFLVSFSFAYVEIQITKASDVKCQRVKKGDTVHLHMVGTLSDGRVFFSSTNRPYSFKVGELEGKKTIPNHLFKPYLFLSSSG